ncbi:MAG: histone H1 [Parabacteroides sp.]|nr:histone H1 [Parabacteroides sp.]
MGKYKSTFQKKQELYKAFETDAQLQIEKGNKAAGTRARKASLELEKLTKEFRKISLEESKK